MLDPEITNTLIWMAQCESISRLFMRKIRWIKIQTVQFIFSPVNPALEVFYFDFIPLHKYTTIIKIAGVQIQAVRPRYQ